MLPGHFDEKGFMHDTFFSSRQELYSTIAAAHDSRHATNTMASLYGGGPILHTNGGLKYQFNFPYHGTWQPLGCQPGYAYRLPFRAILEQKWGSVGVDPKKVNDIGPGSPRDLSSEQSRDVADKDPPKAHATMLAVMDIGIDRPVTSGHHPTIGANADVRSRTKGSSLVTDASRPSPGTVDDNIARSVQPRTTAPLPRRASGISPGLTSPSEPIHRTPMPKMVQHLMPAGSRSSSSESSGRSDDDYNEMSSSAVNQIAGAGIKKSRSRVHPLGSPHKDATPAPSSRVTPSRGTSRRYPCPHGGCSRVCDRPHDLERHLESKVHKAPSYKCESCSQLFTRPDPLKRHRAGRCQAMREEQQARSRTKRQRTW